MIRAIALAGAALLTVPAAAQDHAGHGGNAEAEPLVPAPPPQHDHAEAAQSAQLPSAPPPRAYSGPAHAAAAIWGDEAMSRARAANHAAHGSARFATLLAERLELRAGDGADAYLWDVQGWYGTATDRIVFKSEGEGETGGKLEDAEVQLLWGHAITPWFDLQAGLRLDAEPDATAHLALGVQGLAPYMIHVDAAAFVSDDGDITARIEAEHDMRLNQRLILQPRVEFELAAQDIPRRGVGAGPAKIETGLRLRYEIAREFAPYVGVEYQAALGDTADIARAAGEDPTGVVLLIGLRAWF